MPALVKTEIEETDSNDLDLLEKITKFSKYFWYYSKETIDECQENYEQPDDKQRSVSTTETDSSNKPNRQQRQQSCKPKVNLDSIEWIFFDNGENKKACLLTEICENRLIKVVCIPNDGNRDGIALETVSNQAVQKCIDLNTLPMTDRHKLTASYLSHNQ
jgi:hypothetical protein